jgi:hypothetical protein
MCHAVNGFALDLAEMGGLERSSHDFVDIGIAYKPSRQEDGLIRIILKRVNFSATNIFKGVAISFKSEAEAFLLPDVICRMEGVSPNVGVADLGYSIENSNDYAPIYGTIYFFGSGFSRDLKVNGV